MASSDADEELDRQIDILVMDYLVSGGYPQAAQTFAQEANVQSRSEFESMQERFEIRNAIYRGDIMNAIEKINELNPEVCFQSFSQHRVRR